MKKDRTTLVCEEAQRQERWMWGLHSNTDKCLGTNHVNTKVSEVKNALQISTDGRTKAAIGKS